MSIGFLIQPDINDTCCDCSVKSDACGECGGACCYDDGTCYIQPQSDCETGGGQYQGDDTECDPNPCQVCPTVTLQCDSISASKNKCGFTDPDEHRVWLRKTTDVGNLPEDSPPGGNEACNCGSPPVLTHFTGIPSTFYFADGAPQSGIYEYDSDCVIQTIQAYDGSYYRKTGPYVCERYTAGHSYPDSDPSAFESTEPNCDGDAYIRSGPGTVDAGAISYSDEYTTEMLISRTLDALPAYFGHFGCDESEEIGFRDQEAGQNCVCFASRILVSGESFYSIVRFKPRFVIDDGPATVDFRLDYIVHYEPEPGGGSPSDTLVVMFGQAGDSYLDGQEITEPSSNGTLSITNIEVSCNTV